MPINLADLQEYLKNDLPTLVLNSEGIPFETSKLRQEEWLSIAANNLTDFAKQPCVVRRTCVDGLTQNEVRRWSEAQFLPLQSYSENSPNPLFLGDDSHLYLRMLHGRRSLRRNPGDEIVDDVYIYELVENPLESQLEQVRCKFIATFYKVGYANWSNLSVAERLALVSYQGGGVDAKTALDQLYDGDQIPSLELFLGHAAPNHMRREVWNLGASGELHLNAHSLVWLLKRFDWNTNASVVTMTKTIMAENNEEAIQFITHPNPLIRQHLADLIENKAVLLDWLKFETNETVRRHIFLSLEQFTSISELVKWLAEPDHSPEVIGWVLASWNRGFSSEQEIKALRQALRYPLGKANLKSIKEKLRQTRLTNK